MTTEGAMPHERHNSERAYPKDNRIGQPYWGSVRGEAPALPDDITV